MTDWVLRVITVDPRLNHAELVSTLHHEVSHAERGPFPGWAEAREEAAIDCAVARMLIPLEQLTAAVTWSREPCEVADALQVDVPTLEARVRGLTPEERGTLRVHLARVE